MGKLKQKPLVAVAQKFKLLAMELVVRNMIELLTLILPNNYLTVTMTAVLT